MAVYSENGLTVRWNAPDLVSSGWQSLGFVIVVAARPANPSNVVTALYTTDSGPARLARGYRLRAAPSSDGEELFALQLPPQTHGARVALIPILSCSGRQADPRRGGFPLTPLDQPPLQQTRTRSPRRRAIKRSQGGAVAPGALCLRTGVPLSGHCARSLRHRSGRRDARRPSHEVPPPERRLRTWPRYNW